VGSPLFFFCTIVTDLQVPMNDHIEVSQDVKRQLFIALKDSYPRFGQLEIFVNYELELKQKLSDIASESLPLKEVVNRLIEECQAKGCLVDLINKLLIDNPKNVEVINLKNMYESLKYDNDSEQKVDQAQTLDRPSSTIIRAQNITIVERNFGSVSNCVDSVQSFANSMLESEVDDSSIDKFPRLKELLQKKRLEEADLITKEIIVSQNFGQLLVSDDIERLDNNGVLQKIDQYWRDFYSNDFGLVAQYKTWLSSQKRQDSFIKKLLRSINDTGTVELGSKEHWDQFRTQVGWIDGEGKSISTGKVSFSNEAPAGSLPQTRIWLKGPMKNQRLQFSRLMSLVSKWSNSG